MSMDPYEQQYQQYFNYGGSTNVNVNVNLNDYQQQQQSDGYTYEQQSFQDQTVTNTDCYESQVQQYCQSSPGLPVSSSEPGVWETTESSIHFEAALADSYSSDPYEMQYQQYFQSPRIAPQTASDQPTAYQQPMNPPMDTSQTPTTEMTMNAPTAGMHLEQYQQQQQTDGYLYEQQSFTQTVANTNSYESQVQQNCQSSSGLPGSLSEPGVWETSESSIHSEAALADSYSSDPYEMQYQQYFQSPQIAPQTAWDQSTAYQHPMNPPMDTSETPTTEMTMNAPTADMHLEQQQEEEEDRGDDFLRMVSNEVQYKKLLGQNPYALTDIQVSVLVQRFLDNLEDATQKNNGKVKGQSKLRGQKVPKEERKTVLVLGSGWAAHAFIKLASTYDLRIVVVSPANHFVFTPMLASAAVGTVEYRSMTEPIRVTNPYIDNFVEGRAIGVDVPNRKLVVQLSALSTVTRAFEGVAANAPCLLEPAPFLSRVTYDEKNGVQRDESQGAGGAIELSYDYLVCAVGTAARSSIVPGAKEHSFNLKTSQDSKRLRTALGEALEFASRPDIRESYYPDNEQKLAARQERQRRMRIAIVGGGPTGVELAGELCDFFAQVCRYPDGAFQHLRDDISIMLIHGGSEVLPTMDPELRERALQALQAQGVDVRLNTRLKEVGRDYIRIGEKGSDEVDTIAVGLTVWAAGNAPVRFVQELLSQLPESAAGPGGRINVDNWLRCPTPTEDSFGSILVLGDVACLEAESKYDPTPTPLPQTAQVAGQQGSYAARILNRGYDLQQTPPKLPQLSADEGFSLLRLWLLARGLEEAPGFDFLSLGLLAYVGQEEALNQVQLGDVPLFNYSGKIAFALWRSVYLAKQASSRNQALIILDWLRTESFGRDITRL